MFDKDITVINKYFDRTTKSNKYKVSYIKGFWSSDDGISINNTQIRKNDGYYAMILMNEKDYQLPRDFKESQKGWTLQNEDYLVKGIVENFITIPKLLEEYQDVMKISKISTADYGSEDMRHWEVSGE